MQKLAIVVLTVLVFAGAILDFKTYQNRKYHDKLSKAYVEYAEVLDEWHQDIVEWEKHRSPVVIGKLKRDIADLEWQTKRDYERHTGQKMTQ